MVLVKEMDDSLELKYNKFYIGLSKDGRAFNFVTFQPRKSFVIFEPKIPKSDEVDNLIENALLDINDYNTKRGIYQIRLTSNDLKSHKNLLNHLINKAYQHRIN